MLLILALFGCHGAGNDSENDTDAASTAWPISFDDASLAVMAGLPWASRSVLLLEFVRNDLPSCPTVLDNSGDLVVSGGCGGFFTWTFEGEARYDHSAHEWDLRSWKTTEGDKWEATLDGTASSEENDGVYTVATDHITADVVTHATEFTEDSFTINGLSETAHGLPTDGPDSWSLTASIAGKGSYQATGTASGGLDGWCGHSAAGSITVTGTTTLEVTLPMGNFDCPGCLDWTLDGAAGQTCH